MGALDKYYRRVLVMTNKTGRAALALKRRFRTKGSGPLTWNCNDRAEYVMRDLAIKGISSIAVIEPVKGSEVNHKFVRATNQDGTVEDILRFKK